MSVRCCAKFLPITKCVCASGTVFARSYFRPVCHPWRAKQLEKGCENVIGGANGKEKRTVSQRVAHKELLQGRLGGKITDIAAVPRRVERGRPTLERPVAEGRPEARAASPGARKAGPTAVKASAAPRAPRRAIDVICIVEDVESMALLETERSNTVLVTCREHKLFHAGKWMREKALWRRSSCVRPTHLLSQPFAEF